MSASAAVFVTVSVVSSAIVRSACSGSSGALFTSLTVTVKLLVALSVGVPLSVTMVVNMAVPGPSPSLGVQLITPDPQILAHAKSVDHGGRRIIKGKSTCAALFGTV